MERGKGKGEIESGNEKWRKEEEVPDRQKRR